MENLTNSLEKKESQQPTNDVMSLVAELYAKRELMPMQAEPQEAGQSEE